MLNGVLMGFTKAMNKADKEEHDASVASTMVFYKWGESLQLITDFRAENGVMKNPVTLNGPKTAPQPSK